MGEKIEYKWKSDRGFGVPAQVAGERIEYLMSENNGMLKPRHVVEDARPINSPLHNCFEWRNGVAAERWREAQARRLITCVCPIIINPSTNKPQSVIGNVSVKIPGSGNVFVTTSRAMTDVLLREQVLANAMDQVNGWQSRYRHLSELVNIFEAVESTNMKLRKKLSKLKKAS